MAEHVTLELSDTTVQRAREAARQTNRPLETVLAEWLERVSASVDIFPLDPNATYHIDTLFGSEATAQSLLEMLQAENDANGTTGDHAV
jgi:hypothetical protein